MAKAVADLRFAERGGGRVRPAVAAGAESRRADEKALEDAVFNRTPLVKEQAASQDILDGLDSPNVMCHGKKWAAGKQRQLTYTEAHPSRRRNIALATAEIVAARANLRLGDTVGIWVTRTSAPRWPVVSPSSDALAGTLATKNSPKPPTLPSPLDPIQVRVRIGERDYLNDTLTLSPN